MTTIRANVPDYLAKLAEEAAQRENVTVDQIVAPRANGNGTL